MDIPTLLKATKQQSIGTAMHQPIEYQDATTNLHHKFIESLDGCPYITLDFYQSPSTHPTVCPAIHMLRELESLFKYIPQSLLKL